MRCPASFTLETLRDPGNILCLFYYFIVPAGFFGYPEILDRGFGVILSLTRGMASYPREHFGLRRNLSIPHSLSCQSGRVVGKDFQELSN
ncbi:unnamed protein product [Pleuronectes platessa]|uniref:Uncharacterized protein n=1 Tax=Pleuronectes platessa TaxID=8262 RepID=A0A9N7YKH3_PLEPL|nr:unnamed protein product [Pleuronectes platessa]